MLATDGIPEGSTGTIVGFFTFPEPATCAVHLDGRAEKP
jgi:hypothetical protein